MRQIVLDTETTGREPELGHRVIEIGAVVIENREITEHHFHTYLNPDRESDPGALAVHGLSSEFLADKPKFSEVIDRFVTFLQSAPIDTEIIIHNAKFDTAFLNEEINRCNRAALDHIHRSTSTSSPKTYQGLAHYGKIVDTLALARALHPNQRNSLDALCQRYRIDNTHRQLHGALLDAELLARVYLKMTAGQPSLFGANVVTVDATQHAVTHSDQKIHTNLLIQPATPEERKAHSHYLEKMQRISGSCLWEKQ